MKKEIFPSIKAVISIIIGFLLTFLFTESIALAVFIAGLYLIIDGLIEVSYAFTQESKNRYLIAGLVSILLGIFLFINSDFTITIFVYIVAVKFLLESGSHIFHILKENKLDLNTDLILELLKNLLILGVSVWLIFRPVGNFTYLIRLIGIYALISGLINLFRYRKEFITYIRKSNRSDILNDMKPYLLSALGYGIGFLVGSVIIALFISFDDEFYLKYLEGDGRLIIGSLVIVLTMIFHGLLAGGIGGWLLLRFSTIQEVNKGRILRIIAGPTVATLFLLIPLLIGVFLVGFVTDSDISTLQMIFIFSLFGSFYGLIAALIQTFRLIGGQDKIKVISYMTVGYAIGGAILGLCLYQFLYHGSINYENLSGILWVILGVFSFAAFGGLSIYRSLAYLDQPEKKMIQTTQRETEISRWWDRIMMSEAFANKSFKRIFMLTLLIIIGVSITFAYILNRPDLSERIQIETISTAWQIKGDVNPSNLINPSPSIFAESNCIGNSIHIVDQSGSDISNKLFSFPNCVTESEILSFSDSQGVDHLIWHSDEITDTNGSLRNQDVIYDSVYDGISFSTPTIISYGDIESLVNIYTEGESNYLTWRSRDEVYSASYIPYLCEPSDLPKLTSNAVEISSTFHNNQYPYCNNKYVRMIYTPNPLKDFSEQEPLENSVYEYLADLIAEADREVLITNMWYDSDTNLDSPGYYISEGLRRLHEKVEAEPQKYPRGMTVKVMLGNPPEFLLLDTKGQIWNLLSDLRSADFGNMIQEDIGWKVEVANFGGALPHSHTKQVIIDGDEVVGAGFNITYKHLPTDHPSGKGGDVVDNAIHAKGPIAQVAIAAFDDMWSGSDRTHCENFYPTPADSWQLTCDTMDTDTYHPPESLTYQIEDSSYDDNIFSLYRSSKYKESDEVLGNSILEATDSIDIIQVNYAMDMICSLNILVQVCDQNNFQPYTKAMIKAMKDQNVKVRLITKKEPIEGLENKVAIAELMKELKVHGLEDNIEIKYFDGDFHSKAVNIDKQLLFIGSQNFHYSAWGNNGLTEFNLATDNNEAITEFESFYEYYWERAFPIDE